LRINTGRLFKNLVLHLIIGNKTAPLNQLAKKY